MADLTAEVAESHRNALHQVPGPPPNPLPSPFDLGSDKSGNYGHKGRPGEVGGSAPGGDRTPAEQAKRDFMAVVKRGERAETQLENLRVEMKDAWKAWADDTKNRKKPLKPDGAAAKKLDSYKRAQALEDAYHAAYEVFQAKTDARTARVREILKVPVNQRSDVEFERDPKSPLHPGVESAARRALNTLREFDGSGALNEIIRFPADKVDQFREVFGDKTPLRQNDDGTYSVPVVIKVGRSGSGRAHATISGVELGGRDTDGEVFHEVAHHIEMKSSRIREAAIALRESLANQPREVYTMRENSPALGGDEIALRGRFPDPYSAKLYPHDMATEMVSTGVESYMKSPQEFARNRPEHFWFIFDVMHGKYRSDTELKPSDFKEKT